jgi:hypothetical protein
MIPTGGIGQQLDQLKGLSIQELMQRQSVDPQLVYALALQEKQKMEAAKERQAAMGMEVPQGTEVEKMEADLASRRAPGIQMAAQRSMPQPQMAQGISANPTPNMQAIGRAQGGIIGYAKGDMVEIGAKSKGPIPQMLPEENAMVLKYLEGLKKFDYYDKNPDKVSPEGRQALEQDRRTFEAQFPNSFRQKVNQMIYGPSKGMAMGGEVKGYAGPDGSLVGSDEYLIEDQPVSKEEYDAYLAALDEYNALSQNEKAMVDQRNRLDARMAPRKEPEIKFYTGPNGERLTEDDVRMMVRRGEVGETFARTDNEMRRQRAEVGRREEAERQRRIEEDGPKQTAPEAALTALSGPFSAAGRGINTVLNTIGDDIVPKMGRYVTDKYNEGITALQNRVAEQERQRAFNAEQAQADAIGMRPPTREQAFKELLQPLMDNKQSVDNAMADITGAGAGQGQSTVQTQGGGQNSPPPVKTPPEGGGIRSALTKAKPVASKIAGVLEVLGRGAGASKGFEGAKIVEESRKLREAQADRDARLAEQRALLGARKEELDARNAMAMGMSAADYAAQLTDEALMMSDEYQRIKKDKLDKAGKGLFNPLTDTEEQRIEAEMMAEIARMRREKLQDYKDIMAQYSGVGGQTSVSTTTAPTNYADYNPTT